MQKKRPVRANSFFFLLNVKSPIKESIWSFFSVSLVKIAQRDTLEHLEWKKFPRSLSFYSLKKILFLKKKNLLVLLVRWVQEKNFYWNSASLKSWRETPNSLAKPSEMLDWLTFVEQTLQSFFLSQIILYNFFIFESQGGK